MKIEYMTASAQPTPKANPRKNPMPTDQKRVDEAMKSVYFAVASVGFLSWKLRTDRVLFPRKMLKRTLQLSRIGQI